MKRLSAQYIITNKGPALKRGIICVDDNGVITDIEDTGGRLQEERFVEFYNGIIIPGFVNCHCHLELSYLKNCIPEGTGLTKFIEHVRTCRTPEIDKTIPAAEEADRAMYKAGISLCADICNTADTFSIKKASNIKYHNFLEVFGIDPLRAEVRMNEVFSLSGEARRAGLIYHITPHSFYSVSAELFDLLLSEIKTNKVVSVHFMESPDEEVFLHHHTGSIPESYKQSGILKGSLSIPDYRDIIRQIRNNLILVHNTFIDHSDLILTKNNGNSFYCLCPDSNIFIEKSKPPVELLVENGCRIIIGTDSLASNGKLDIMSELITLQLSFPQLTLFDLVQWATINGALALNEEEFFGVIETGKSPGLVLLENVDLQNMKLTSDSTATRLV